MQILKAKVGAPAVDVNNRDPALRSRPILGIAIVSTSSTAASGRSRRNSRSPRPARRCRGCIGGTFDGAALEQRYRRASVMAAVLPLGAALPGRTARTAFFWSMRADRITAWRERGLDAWKEEVLELWPAVLPLLAQIDAPEQLTFVRYAHCTLRSPVAPALVHLGDAWHSASPQLGQGATMALLGLAI